LAPEGAGRAPGLGRARLEPIIAPWLADPGGWSIAIEDPAGRVVAGSQADRAVTEAQGRISADVVIDGAVAFRVVAQGPAPAGHPLPAAIESLAIALGELLTEGRSHDATRRALEEERSLAVAETLGTDARELAKGRRQQRSFVSLVAPDVRGYDLASHYAAARDIGGDFFELFRLQRRGHPLAIAVADVTGKGLDAALLMAFSRPVLHTALNAASGPADALARTNRVLVGERRATLFVTAVCAVLEPGRGRIRVANAGHEPPLLVPADGSPVAPVGESGALIGAFASLAAPETEATLLPGDMMLFYTDGATDTVDPTGERFGDERLLATIEAARDGSAHDLVAAIRDAIQSFRSDVEPADDLTLVAIGRHRRSSTRR
jgi:serine phosphatase RsbU (regulator of sigma subunit)